VTAAYSRQALAQVAGPEPAADCTRCPRLVEFRRENREAQPGWFNAPVPSFGCEASQLLIVGLAPGLNGANRTGRPFTGDFAGELLYGTLIELGLAKGRYAARADDGLDLGRVMISNAVRCVPPANRPTGGEIRACQPFLASRVAALPRLRAILALGRIAHDSTLQALGRRKSAHPFAHGARHRLSDTLSLFDSYHCSRYNTSTGKLTPAMFRDVLMNVRGHLDGGA
jgi:uracil-DNA glycosylase family 4